MIILSALEILRPAHLMYILINYLDTVITVTACMYVQAVPDCPVAPAFRNTQK